MRHNPRIDPDVASRTPRTRSAWLLSPNLLRYGLSFVSVGGALLVMEALKLLSVADARPALLVAVAASGLYGGIGPSVIALLLAAVIARDPGVLVSGMLLVTLCAVYRRARSRSVGTESSTGRNEPAAEAPADRFEKGVEIPAPSFIEVTTEATWRFHHEQPLDITLPEDEQVEHLYLYSVLAECNDAFARMYGFRTAADVVGTRLVVFLPPSNSENVTYLGTFIRSGYRLEDAESHEIDRYGNSKHFVNNLVGIFERGQLVGAWGTQRDVTARKAAEPQEYRSRIHSSKSSSQ